MTIIPKINCPSVNLLNFISMVKIYMVIKNIFAVTVIINFPLNLNQTTYVMVSIPDVPSVVRLLFCTIITNITLITGAVIKGVPCFCCFPG
jgi:hypothetical protein